MEEALRLTYTVRRKTFPQSLSFLNRILLRLAIVHLSSFFLFICFNSFRAYCGPTERVRSGEPQVSYLTAGSGPRPLPLCRHPGPGEAALRGGHLHGTGGQLLSVSVRFQAFSQCFYNAYKITPG